MPIYQRSFEVHAPLSEVAAFHDDPGSLIAITPLVRVTVERFDAPVQAGSQVIFTLHVGPIGMKWAAVIAEYQPQKYFRDVQTRGHSARGVTCTRSPPGRV